MSTSRKLPILLVATLATAGFIAVQAAIGVVSQLRTVSELSGVLSFLPPVFWFGLAGNVAKLLACGTAFAAILYVSSHRVVKLSAVAGIGVPFALLLAWWPFVHVGVVNEGGSLLLMHTLRTIAALWFAFLLVALLSNYAFKRTAGTGRGVS
jgi:hypothetical protein